MARGRPCAGQRLTDSQIVDGRLLRIIGVSFDLTQRKAAERERLDGAPLSGLLAHVLESVSVGRS
jgi:hypothetical protein